MSIDKTDASKPPILTMSPPLEQHLQQLTDAARGLLQIRPEISPESASHPPTISQPDSLQAVPLTSADYHKTASPT